MSTHASKAVLGYGTLVEYGVPVSDPTSGDPAEVFTTLHDVITSDPPDEQTDEVEVSHYQSPLKTKEFIQGWIDAGSATIELNWNPRQWPDHTNILADKVAGTKRNWRVVLPEDEGAPIETITFPAFVKGLKRSIDNKGAVKCTVTLRCSAVTSVVDEIS